MCDADDGAPIAAGEDFEYATSPDTFVAVQCRRCGLVYLNPRPEVSELERIYPPSYHAFDFSASRFGLAYRVREQLEARRLRRWARGLPVDARILDVGCGDGFHLRILRRFGRETWTLEGIDASPRAVAAARSAGLQVHHGTIETTALPREAYDLVLLIATIEHVADPASVLAAIRDVLRPGGRAIIMTDNTETLSFRWFRRRHWGGYHFPRHWNLFSRRSLRALASRTGFETVQLRTALSPVNWVYSLHNALVDARAPRWLIARFTLRSPVALGVFTGFDALQVLAGRGTLLEAVLRRPVDGGS